MLKKLMNRLHYLSDRLQGKKYYFFTNTNPVYANYSIGDYTYGEPIIEDFGSHLTIGRFCSIAKGVTILLGGEHNIQWISTYPFNEAFEEHRTLKGHPATKGDTKIGNDVWLGTDALLLSGITIGDGAVIAARSVVIKDVPPYTIVGGNPARPIRARFPEETIRMLQDLKWWDWPIEKIKKHAPQLMSSDLESLIKVQ